MEDGLSSNGIWLKAIDAPSAAPATIVLDDQGRGNSAVYAADRLNRGEQVLAVDLPFNGESWHKDTAWMFRADLAAGAEPVRDRRPAPGDEAERAPPPVSPFVAAVRDHGQKTHRR